MADVYASKGTDCVCQQWDGGSPWRTPGFHHVLCNVAFIKNGRSKVALADIVGKTPAWVHEHLGMVPSA